MKLHASVATGDPSVVEVKLIHQIIYSWYSRAFKCVNCAVCNIIKLKNSLKNIFNETKQLDERALYRGLTLLNYKKWIVNLTRHLYNVFICSVL